MASHRDALQLFRLFYMVLVFSLERHVSLIASHSTVLATPATAAAADGPHQIASVS